MSVMVTGTFPKTLQHQVKTFWGDYKEDDLLYKRIFRGLTTDQAYEEDVLITSFGLVPKKNEGAPTQYDNMTQGYTTRYNQATYALGFIVTWEQIKYGKTVSVLDKGMNYLSISLKQTKETLAANVLNRAFNNSYAYGDGKELCATDHPSRAGNFSNEMATPSAFAEASLEDLITQIKTTTNDRGRKIKLSAKDLIIPPALMFQANRVLKSTQRVNTANNDLNALKNMGYLQGDPVVNEYLTSATAFFITTDAPEGLKSYESEAGAFSKEGDFETGDTKCKIMAAIVFGNTDPRGIFASSGTGS